jgi:hypothetical protein
MKNILLDMWWMLKIKTLKNKNEEGEIKNLWTFIAHNNNYKVF